MAKGVYIGVDGKARAVKQMYIGVKSDVPIYNYETVTETLSASTIGDCFEVTNGEYYFEGSGTTFTTNNGGVKSSTATTTLKAKTDISALSFNYSYSSESGYDKFTLIVAGETVANGLSGATKNKTWSGSLAAGQEISFKYAKDGSGNENSDKCTFSNMSATYSKPTIAGYESKVVARKIVQAYIGDKNNIAKLFFTSAPANTYWLITTDGITRYNVDGTTESLGNPGQFSFPSGGTYSIELHGGGGGAGGGARSISDTYMYQDRTGNGGAGGSSGAQWTVTLTSGEKWTYRVGTAGQNGTYDSSQYGQSCTGDDGTDGGATTLGSYSVTGGKGGEGGYAYVYQSTSSAGSAGAMGSASPTAGATILSTGGSYTNPGSSGSTVGTYGTGASASTSGYTSTDSATDGAIIIRKTA